EWGMQPLPASSGLALFDRLLQQGYEQVVVFHGKKNKFLQQEDSPAPPPVVTNNLTLRDQVTKKVFEFISVNLKLELTAISLDEELGDYGFDSISLTKLANQINDYYDLSLTPTVFYSHSTVEKLVNHLLEEYAANIIKHHEAPHTPHSSSHEGMMPPVDILPGAGKNRRFMHESPVISPLSEPVAIVGMNGRFPGSADLQQFWEHLKSNHDLVT
ncbi:phosphopantetheine-binding protein, partial [Chitinophaga sp. 22536]|uniref:acyl carrier protein n=1 Tax=unclassified Chitinophaga TaxID=2619133 RepID=UPI003F836278